MAIKIIAFDLDETLYDEHSYLLSGYSEVAMYMSKTFREGGKTVGVGSILTYMLNVEAKFGRSFVFQATLGTGEHFNANTKKNVKKCIQIYRQHIPDICLYPEAKKCLNRFSKFPQYLISDGNKYVQNNKVKALGLDKIMEAFYLTNRYGNHYAKPCPYCFFLVAKREKGEPNEIVYIGDNPHKDFIEIKKHGFHTIRVLTGRYKDIKVPEERDAHITINNLSELTEEVLEKLSRRKKNEI